DVAQLLTVAAQQVCLMRTSIPRVCGQPSDHANSSRSMVIPQCVPEADRQMVMQESGLSPAESMAGTNMRIQSNSLARPPSWNAVHRPVLSPEIKGHPPANQYGLLPLPL